MALDVNAITNLLYTIFTLVIPAISYLSSRGKAKKKDVNSDLSKLVGHITRLEKIDQAQQEEINRLKHIKKIDADRMHRLHEIIRKRGGDK